VLTPADSIYLMYVKGNNRIVRGQLASRRREEGVMMGMGRTHRRDRLDSTRSVYPVTAVSPMSGLFLCWVRAVSGRSGGRRTDQGVLGWVWWWVL